MSGTEGAPQPEAAPRRAVRKSLSVAALALTVAACGSSGSKSSTTTTPPASLPAPSTTAAADAIEVTPATGPLGTTFQIHAKLQPQEKVAIEIDLPNGKTFTGQAHTAANDGAVSTVYRTTTADPAGTFQVKATGDHGDQSIGHFTATAGGTAATTKARATSTTFPGAATTTIRGATTTIRPSTSTTKHA